jgi:anti-anti-sigma factor
MQARIRIQNEMTLVFLSGRIDVETAVPFRAALQQELKGKRLVFDFSSLSFVGSLGILPFIEALQLLQETNPGSFKFSGVGIEFRKLISATSLTVVEIHETSELAALAFFKPQDFTI